ncbi:MAG TPA: PrsW family glutamic-type intramembrane protease [Anaerolineae bacterium]|nr:PrsW family glutamic-type intramembrane protease [Anaerolineae bacterium]
MSKEVCCVCQAPLAEGARTIGKRCYCPEHYARVTRERGHVWHAGWVLVAALMGFIVLVVGVDRFVQPSFEGVLLLAAGILLALVPALIWLLFFYLLDRLEPEPKRYVIGVFFLGALLAAAIGIPLVNDLFGVSGWLYEGALVQLVGGILVIGFAQEFLKYAAVRYTVFGSREFDERLDGVIYGTAAGLGYATMLNIHYVLSHAGVDLSVGVIRIVVTALAQASFSGIVGYFLAQDKFEGKPVWWMPLGLALAAVLNGTFVFVRDLASVRGLQFNPWNGLILAAVVALAVLGVLFWLMRKANRATLAEA